MIYDINGNAISTLYNVSGGVLSSVYDVDGNLIDGTAFTDETTVTNTYTASYTWQPQGGCVDDDGNLCSAFPTVGKFVKHNLSTGTETQYNFTANTYGHMNGMTYCPLNERFYVASQNNTGEVYVFDKSFTLKDTIIAKDGSNNIFNCWNIAFNQNTSQFICMSGNGDLRFMDSDFVFVKQVSFDINDWVNTHQDIETDGNYIYAVSYNANAICVFDFLGNTIKEISNTAFTGEPESLCYDWENDLFYMEGKDSYYVIRKTEFIAS